MKKIHILFVLLIMSTQVGCSINVAQPPVIIPSPQIANLQQPTETSSPESVATASPNMVATIPVTWADLNLTGRLVYISVAQGSNGPILGINILNLITGEIDQVFKGPDISWVYYLRVAPDNKLLVMSYTGAPQANTPDNPELYVLPLDGSKPPQLLVAPASQSEQYTQAEWSPDGKYIYYVYNNYQNQPTDQHYPLYQIYRMPYPSGQPEKIADQAFWPRLSSDDSQLVYISMDPVTGKNKIFIANADGSNARMLNITGAWNPDIIDAPIFSPDGQSIIFSALSPQQSYEPSWLEKLMGIEVAEAHSIPSDWWSIPLAGGVATRLTSLRTVGLFASISPDKQHIASYSGSGLFVMKPDGSNITMLISDMGGVAGMVGWIP